MRDLRCRIQTVSPHSRGTDELSRVYQVALSLSLFVVRDAGATRVLSRYLILLPANTSDSTAVPWRVFSNSRSGKSDPLYLFSTV